MDRSQRAKDRRLRKTYGITLIQYNAMLAMRNGRCWICGRPPKKVALHVDHDHKTKRVRGLLDYRCNHRLLGRGLELPELHEAAAAYLRSSFDGRSI